jgi:hypothetical protein
MIKKFEIQDENWKAYGFHVERNEYYKLPMGMISSMKAEKYSDNTTEIEFNIQSPSGTPDSSDFLTYTMPAINSFERAKAIVDQYAAMLEAYIFSISA